MARWGTQFGHRGIQTLAVSSGPQRRTTAGTGRCGGNDGAAEARVGVVSEHRVAEAKVRNMEASPNDGRWWLATGRRSGGAGTVTRAHASCETRQCTG
jgi:hypothetical protein